MSLTTEGCLIFIPLYEYILIFGIYPFKPSLFSTTLADVLQLYIWLLADKVLTLQKLVSVAFTCQKMCHAHWRHLWGGISRKMIDRSSMLGSRSGLQAHVKDLQKEATSVHCNARNINLAFQDADFQKLTYAEMR